MQRGRQEPVDLTLHLIVNPLHPLRRLLLDLVVLDEQPRDGRAERRLPGLQRHRHLRARRVFPALGRQRKRAIDRVPELRQRVGEAIAIRRRPGRHRQFGLARERLVEIAPDARELRRPGHQRIRVVIVQHVPHRQPELIQVVLDAQQLQGILAVPLHQIALEHPQAGQLAVDVQRVGHDRGERQDQPDEQARRGRTTAGSAARHRQRLSETAAESPSRAAPRAFHRRAR